jgi:hypothetical protein
MELVYKLCAEYKVLFTLVHVIGVVIGMGAALMSDMLFSFYGHNKKLSHSETYTLTLLSRVVLGGLVIIFFSGIGLFLSDVSYYLVSVKFLAKMTIMIVLLINGFILHKYISGLMTRRGFLSNHRYTGSRKLAFACGAVSVVSWFSLCALGILESVPTTYTLLMSLYTSVTLGAIIVALIVEQKKFE